MRFPTLDLANRFVQEVTTETRSKFNGARCCVYLNFESGGNSTQNMIQYDQVSGEI